MRNQDKEGQPVDAVVAKLNGQIEDFNKGLDPQDEVGLSMAQFGSAAAIYPDAVTSDGPSLIVFEGQTEMKGKVRLVQHVSQVSLALVTLPKRTPNKPRIGFGG